MIASGFVMALESLDRQFRAFRAIVHSSEQQSRFMQKFREDNSTLAVCFSDRMRGPLANRGWFVAGSLYPQQYPRIANALEKGEEEVIERLLQDHIRGRVPEIRQHTLSKWPERASVISDAFEAHGEGKYTLSIPVMLAQADGVSLEILGAFLFSSYKGKVADAASGRMEGQLACRPLAQSFLGLLLEASGLSMDTQERDELLASGQVVSPLNRHGVLHGIDCEYATEGNSLRAIALLQFLAWVTEVTDTGRTSP